VDDNVTFVGGLNGKVLIGQARAVTRVIVSRIGFPEGSTAIGLGSGLDPSTGDVVRFSVSGPKARELMARVAQGDFPEVDLHEAEILDWRTWFEEG
jgi:glycine cleavage system aminomethyltransferase T